MDYVHAVRVERARQRLESGRQPVEDVGYEVGYEDPTFFRRLFKRTTGVTPAAYRKKFTPITPGSPAG
jgi:YesN/AraC family two-component response regulator